MFKRGLPVTLRSLMGNVQEYPRDASVSVCWLRCASIVLLICLSHLGFAPEAAAQSSPQVAIVFDRDASKDESLHQIVNAIVAAQGATLVEAERVEAVRALATVRPDEPLEPKGAHWIREQLKVERVLAVSIMPLDQTMVGLYMLVADLGDDYHEVLVQLPRAEI